ncbi:MAG: hypothetical protein AAGJ46_21775, partial [Planctomycetota bacterium]
MASLPLHRRYAVLFAWLLALLMAPGCAMNRLPRIDPSGERIVIWPEPAAPTVAAPGTATTTVPGNVTTPPVFAPDSGGGCFLFGGRGCGLFSTPTVVGPPVGPPQVGQSIVTGPPGPRDRVVITPEKVLAPVGTEVIVRAGLCQKSGYLLNNERIEWSLDRSGVGHFVTLGDRGEADPLRLPWERPSKVDSHYAIGYTTPIRECLRRNTADPLDDVQVRKGDAWISVSSPTEGTSYVSAF